MAPVRITPRSESVRMSRVRRGLGGIGDMGGC